MKAFVTGGLGFLGKHLVAQLLEHSWDVFLYDRHVPTLPDDRTIWGVSYYQGDLLEAAALETAMRAVQPDVVFHLAALADVRSALKMPREQLAQNLTATLNVLEAMRAAQVTRIAFTSTAVVYGDTSPQDVSVQAQTWTRQISERSYCFPQQTSIYGAMKLASESLIAAYCEGHGFSADIYRLVSVLGPGYRHGNLMDFYQRLKSAPATMTLFGSPTQEKYYIGVQDVMDAILLTVSRSHTGCELWNVSHDTPRTIQDSITATIDVLGIPPPTLVPGNAWAGDLPQLVLDCSKLRSLGWSPKVDILEAMRATVRDLVGHEDSQTLQPRLGRPQDALPEAK